VLHRKETAYSGASAYMNGMMAVDNKIVTLTDGVVLEMRRKTKKIKKNINAAEEYAGAKLGSQIREHHSRAFSGD
jgi:hypothetical protein